MKEVPLFLLKVCFFKLLCHSCCAIKCYIRKADSAENCSAKGRSATLVSAGRNFLTASEHFVDPSKYAKYKGTAAPSSSVVMICKMPKL